MAHGRSMPNYRNEYIICKINNLEASPRSMRVKTYFDFEASLSAFKSRLSSKFDQEIEL